MDDARGLGGLVARIPRHRTSHAMPDAMPDAMPHDDPTGDRRPPASLRSLAQEASTVPHDADFGIHADRLIADRAGFVVTDGPRIIAVVGHDRLLSLVTRTGGDLFRNRPIGILLEVLGPCDPILLSDTCPLSEAVNMALARPEVQRLDPLVIDGSPPRLLDMVPLLLEHAAFAADAAAEADRQRQAAEAAGRARTSFLATMSHELRTPLNAILGFVELLHEGTGDAREQARCLDVIHRNGHHLLSLISDMLDLTRLESEHGAPVHRPLNPSELLADVVESLQARAIQQATTLEVLVDRTSPHTLAGDETRLRQVLLNIIANAVKFSPGERVSVRMGRLEGGPDDAATPTDRWYVECRDTGIGMTPATVARMFEPFVQADDGTTRRFGGTGLGLTIARRIIESESGTIQVDSEPGRGSCFRVVLPVIVPNAAEMQPTTSASPDASTRPVADGPATVGGAAGPATRILVIEDGPDNIRLFRTVLERAGHHVTIAENGAEGLRRAEEARSAGASFDCVLMDRHMPVMDGTEATRRLRAGGHRMPIIAVSASTSAEDRADFAKAGCDQFLAKPVPPKALRAAIAAAIASQAPIDRDARRSRAA